MNRSLAFVLMSPMTTPRSNHTVTPDAVHTIQFFQSSRTLDDSGLSGGHQATDRETNPPSGWSGRATPEPIGPLPPATIQIRDGSSPC